ncbi:HNH endonuclease [Peribacillus simplex]|uniref:HNH endonuclease n=2 Tax=Peribacillus TaxID=2675229 RepID=A0AA90PH60_9BACI|nr:MULTISPECIES: HNH endonuclease [Peribacillus]MDP1421690.1 HNH endonuclease [Peribacillus simplex]MDP1454386.1 HNH endonuclease [Peribacillus frigoritolerans]
MAKAKHENLSYNQGLYTANILMQRFYFPEEYYDLKYFWDECKDEIISSLVKPQKWTLVHMWLEFYSDISEELYTTKKNLDTPDYFEVLKDVLLDTDLIPNIPEPIFENKECSSLYPCVEDDCELCQVMIDWEKHVDSNIKEINKNIVHSAFQIMFSNRRFMHDFNLELSNLIEEDIDYICENSPETLTKGKIKRNTYWPVWLKEALLYRDKGTCVLCRKSITGQYSISTDLEIDHIVPLNLFGTNDASNFQLLCKKCNTTKQGLSSASNAINVPFWNI